MKRLHLLTVVVMFLASTMTIFSQVKSERLSGTYEGAQKKGIANGLGKAVGKDSYEGNFKKGLPDGLGTYVFGEDIVLFDYPYVKGDKYEGEFKAGKFEGKGKITFVDPEKGVLDGYFTKGKYTGKTKEGFTWVKAESEGVLRVIVKCNGTARNDIYLTGMNDLAEIGRVHPVFSSITKSWEDIRTEDFPYTIFVKGMNPNTGATMRVKVVIETPGQWQIRVVPSI